MDGVLEWCKEHKLRTIGGVWVSGIAASMAYNATKPGLRTSLKVRTRVTPCTSINVQAACSSPTHSFKLEDLSLPTAQWPLFQLCLTTDDHPSPARRPPSLSPFIPCAAGHPLACLRAGPDARMSHRVGRGGDVRSRVRHAQGGGGGGPLPLQGAHRGRRHEATAPEVTKALGVRQSDCLGRARKTRTFYPRRAGFFF